MYPFHLNMNLKKFFFIQIVFFFLKHLTLKITHTMHFHESGDIEIAF